MKSYTPTHRLFILLGLLALLAVGCFVWDWFALIWLLGLLLTGVTIIAEMAMLVPAKLIMQSHRFSHQPTVQTPVTMSLTLAAKLSSKVQVAIEAVQSDLLYLQAVKPSIEINDGAIEAQWVVTPKERGNLEWPGTLISFSGPFQFITKWQRLEPLSFRVYPKLNSRLSTILNPAMLLEQMGVKTHRFKRADQLFESLRPYQVGDNYRHIDWKASARSTSLVTRQFEMENHHNILVCLDSSRLMGTLTEGITKLDWAIEATLHLAYLADYLKDRIGLVVFSNEIQQWVRPQKASVEAFLRTTYDVQCQLVESDFSQVCAQILATQKKRSLVIFLSDFIDAASMQAVLPSFAQLNRKHCSLFIGIEDPAYKKHLGNSADMHSSLALARRIVAQDSMNRREAILRKLRKMGLRAITTTPDMLVENAMNAYLEAKLQGAI
ncbi:MAG: hypothetical protein K0Q50_1192 [Vampirovibrio sp.]|jgi:uncharacterized protein (DUF58 family)|nr:hypothetical protein [Vampirovibrio sp.]